MFEYYETNKSLLNFVFCVVFSSLTDMPFFGPDNWDPKLILAQICTVQV